MPAELDPCVTTPRFLLQSFIFMLKAKPVLCRPNIETVSRLSLLQHGEREVTFIDYFSPNMGEGVE